MVPLSFPSLLAIILEVNTAAFARTSAENSTKLAPLHEMYNIAKLEIISEMII